MIALIFGGLHNHEGTVYTLNLETMKSGTIDNVSYQRCYHSSSSINNQVYLFGGRLNDKDYNDL